MILPFDLELAKHGHPIISRAGHPVRIICFNRKSLNDRFPIIALHTTCDEGEIQVSHINTGAYFASVEPHGHDLFMLVEEKEYYINIYMRGDNIPYAGAVIGKKEIANDIAERSEFFITQLSFKI